MYIILINSILLKIIIIVKFYNQKNPIIQYVYYDTYIIQI